VYTLDVKLTVQTMICIERGLLYWWMHHIVVQELCHKQEV
jgi:hypothetical protein